MFMSPVLSVIRGSQSFLTQWLALSRLSHIHKKKECFVYPDCCPNRKFEWKGWSSQGRGSLGGEGSKIMLPLLRLPTKTYHVLKILTDRNYAMFFNIENYYYRQQSSSKPFEIWAFIVKICNCDEICTDKT